MKRSSRSLIFENKGTSENCVLRCQLHDFLVAPVYTGAPSEIVRFLALHQFSEVPQLSPLESLVKFQVKDHSEK